MVTLYHLMSTWPRRNAANGMTLIYTQLTNVIIFDNMCNRVIPDFYVKIKYSSYA
jgi:hypothetical protein